MLQDGNYTHSRQKTYFYFMESFKKNHALYGLKEDCTIFMKSVSQVFMSILWQSAVDF
jgi:hypothetical protein